MVVLLCRAWLSSRSCSVPTAPPPIHTWARASLASVVLTAVAITVNHLFALGPKALLLGLALVVVATVLLLWFRRTKSPTALAGYLLMNLWIVVGFGLWKGLWKGALRLYLGTLLSSVSSIIPGPFVGHPSFEVELGVAMFIGALFVLYCAVQLVRAEQPGRRGTGPLPVDAPPARLHRRGGEPGGRRRHRGLRIRGPGPLGPTGG